MGSSSTIQVAFGTDGSCPRCDGLPVGVWVLTDLRLRGKWSHDCHCRLRAGEGLRAQDQGPGRSRPAGGDRRGARLPRAERCRQDHDDPRPARDAQGATPGRSTLLGGDPWRDAVALHRRLAYVPGEVNLWPNLTGGEVIDLLGDLRGGLDATPSRRRCSSASSSTRTKRIRAYSKGNRQKVALVAAFVPPTWSSTCSTSPPRGSTR